MAASVAEPPGLELAPEITPATRPPPGLEDFAPDVAENDSSQPTAAAQDQQRPRQRQPAESNQQQPRQPVVQPGPRGPPGPQAQHSRLTNKPMQDPPSQASRSPGAAGRSPGAGYSGTPFPGEPGNAAGRPMPSQSSGGRGPGQPGHVSRSQQGQPPPGAQAQMPRGPGGAQRPPPQGPQSGGPQQRVGNQQVEATSYPGAWIQPGMGGQHADAGMGMQEPSNWLAGGRSAPSHSSAAGPNGRPESQMLPSPGMPTGPGMQYSGYNPQLGMQMPAMPMPGLPLPGMNPWAMGPQGNARMPMGNPVGGHFQDAISMALQKFATAAEVQSAATPAQALMDERQAAQMRARNTANKLAAAASEDMEMAAVNAALAAANTELALHQRLQAQAQAEANATRLLAAGTPIAPGGRSGETGSPARENIVQDSIVSGAPSTELWLGAQEKRYEGRVKTYSVVQGFGFIQCVEMHQLYGCDAFLNTAVAGGIVVGSTVSFSVEMRNGKPQARDVRLDEGFAGPSTTTKEFDAPGVPVPGLSTDTHRGRVKSFNAAKGFGFIFSRDLQYNFGGRDIYVSKTQAPEGTLSVGQEVDFQLVLDRHGQPQARSVQGVVKLRGPGLVAMGAGLPLFA